MTIKNSGDSITGEQVMEVNWKKKKLLIEMFISYSCLKIKVFMKMRTNKKDGKINKSCKLFFISEIFVFCLKYLK